MLGRIEDTLKLFNRKERYWVVHTALGSPAATLSAAFCDAINGQLDLKEPVTPSSAWWAMDYHIDWLQAALRLHPNVSTTKEAIPQVRSADSKRCDIQGQQEDIDLVVAHNRDVVLVEAKAFGSWSNKQLESKLERLRALPISWDTGEVTADGVAEEEPIRVHFILLSPNRPTKLSPSVLQKWPAWGKHCGSPCWVHLSLGEPEDRFFKVNRCNATGKSLACGGHWIPAPVSRPS